MLWFEKLEKIKIVQGHIATLNCEDPHHLGNAEEEIDSDTDSDSDANESGDDFVINVHSDNE